MTWSTAVASVVVGLLLSTRTIKSRTGPWMLDLHRFLGGISVLFLAVHIGTLYLDSFVDFGPRELFIPGESTWNSEAAAWGIIAMYALVLVEVTSLLRKYLNHGVWRTFHMLSVVTAAAGTYHAILGGSDVDNPLTWAVAGAGSAIVIALIALRLRRSDQPTSRRAAKADARETLLLEMRDRLETLPIVNDMPHADVAADGVDVPPRESTVPTGPAAGAFGRGAAAAPAAAANPFVAPPFEPEPNHDSFTPAMPPPEASPGTHRIVDTDDQVNEPFTTTPPADPFAATPADPFATTPPADPFATTPPADPFATSPTLGPFEASTAAVNGDLFAPATAAEAAAEVRSREPFPEFNEPMTSPPVPPTPIPSDPVPAEPASMLNHVPSAAPEHPFAPPPPVSALNDPVTTEGVPGPPPVPNAIDPLTGEPDKAAYTAWLIEWLAYADNYGEDTPEDPNRFL